MYCGNNGNNRELLNGTKVLGTPYQCLQKGIGRGFNLPCDMEYKGEYAPIDEFNIYCGNSPNLPEGYDRIGSPAQCLSKGVGIGKSRKANSCSRFEAIFGKGFVKFWLIYSIIIIPIMIYLYVATPSFFMKRETSEGEISKDWSKLIPYTIIINIIVYIILRKILK